jgi:hypothetical protein
VKFDPIFTRKYYEMEAKRRQELIEKVKLKQSYHHKAAQGHR